MKTYIGEITELQDNEIFVFGSNLSGRHGAGAAKTALNWGAKLGIGEGLQGQTYAIPTKGYGVLRSLSLSEIRIHVEKFLDFTKKNPQLKFLVTPIGCGLAGFTPEQIAPLFIGSFDNVYLPLNFTSVLNSMPKYSTAVISPNQRFSIDEIKTYLNTMESLTEAYDNISEKSVIQAVLDNIDLDQSLQVGDTTFPTKKLF